MAEDPWGYVHYRNVTGSDDSDGSGCSNRAAGCLWLFIVVLLPIILGLAKCID